MGWLYGEIKYIDARRTISAVYDAIIGAEETPAAQAAARAVNQSALTIHVPAHGMGLAFYGTAALAFARVGVNESHDIYEQIAAEECGKMETALTEISIFNEAKPAKIDLRIWPQWQIK